jgi:hypothetical protein
MLCLLKKDVLLALLRLFTLTQSGNYMKTYVTGLNAVNRQLTVKTFQLREANSTSKEFATH